MAKKGVMPKFIPDNRGRVRTEETKRKISETLKRKGIKPPSRKGITNPDALCRKAGYFAHLQKRRVLRKKTNGGSHTFKEWLQLKEAYRFTCPCCGVKEPDIKLTIDHIEPISLGGTDDINNIQPLCIKCNMSKSVKTIKYEVFIQ